MHELIARTNAQTSVAHDTTNAAGFYSLAGLKLAAGDAEGAIAAYRQCIALTAPNAAIYNNLGAALIKAARFNEAIAALETAIALQPTYARARVNLGKALREVGRVQEAISRLREILAINPNYVPALINIGDAFAADGESDAAKSALELAVQIEPKHVEARIALGIVHLQTGYFSLALNELQTAITLQPDHADAHSHLGHALFVSGDWQAAWPHFEYRFRRHAHRAKLQVPAGMSRWDGNTSNDMELWLIAEQGLGDQLQFVRYAKLLYDNRIQCVLACDQRIVALLSLAQLGLRIVPLQTVTDNLAARWFPLMSLPLQHGTRPDTVPAAHGYLSAEPARIERWRSRIPTKPLHVALAWAGNPKTEYGRYVGRSPPLAALEPLLSVPQVQFISLQKGPGEEQLATVPFGQSILNFDDLDAGPNAFLDTAAILKCVDLFITSDTAIAHLAGALGVQTWLCLMHEPDWRWMPYGKTTPWYNSMRLFRQTSPGNWPGVFREVAASLKNMILERSANAK